MYRYLGNQSDQVTIIKLVSAIDDTVTFVCVTSSRV